MSFLSHLLIDDMNLQFPQFIFDLLNEYIMKVKFISVMMLAFLVHFSNAQTYYYPDPPSAVNVNSCDDIQLQLTGYFNDGCGYFNLNYNATQVVGNTVYCHITARNYGCDSGWVCTFALVNVNGIYSFPPINATGNFNLKLVSHNVCMGMDNMDTTNVGNFNLTTFATNNTLTSNAVGNIYIGMPVTYQVSTNIPFNYTSNWYRNGSLVNSSPNSTSWATTLQTNSDTVSVKIVSDTLCILEPDTWSNKIILNVNPNSINSSTIDQIAVFRDQSTNNVALLNLKGNESLELFSLEGKLLLHTNVSSSHRFIIPFNKYPNSIYILKIIQDDKIRIIKF
jgi:hypothetical protein